MKTVQLFRVGAHLFGLEKVHIIGTIGRQHEKVRIERLGNQESLLLSKGRRAVIFDLRNIFFEQPTGISKAGALLVMNVDGEFMAFHVSRLEGQVSLSEDNLRPLPPLFGEEARSICPVSMVNGKDIIILIDHTTFHACFNII